jgi:alpha-glucosidase
LVQGKPVDRATNPNADWYVWADRQGRTAAPPSNWQSVFGGPAWTWDARRGQYYLHNFLSRASRSSTVHSPEVQDATLVDVAKFWLDRGVDGFRLDATQFRDARSRPTDATIRPILGDTGKPRTRTVRLPAASSTTRSHDDIPAFLDPACAQLTDSRTAAASWSPKWVGRARRQPRCKLYHRRRAGSPAHSAYGFALSSTPITLAPALIRRRGGHVGRPGTGHGLAVLDVLEPRRAAGGVALGPEEARSARLLSPEMSMLLLLISLRGNVFLYPGRGIGPAPRSRSPYDRPARIPRRSPTGQLTLGRDGARTPMPWVAGAAHAGFSRVEPWLPIDPSHIDLAVDRQERDADSTLNVTRRVVALRRRLPGLRTGAMTLVDAPEPLLVFLRGHGADQVLCAFNLGFESVAWDLPAGWRAVDGVNLASHDALPPMGGLLARRV